MSSNGYALASPWHASDRRTLFPRETCNVCVYPGIHVLHVSLGNVWAARIDVRASSKTCCYKCMFWHLTAVLHSSPIYHLARTPPCTSDHVVVLTTSCIYLFVQIVLYYVQVRANVSICQECRRQLDSGVSFLWVHRVCKLNSLPAALSDSSLSRNTLRRKLKRILSDSVSGQQHPGVAVAVFLRFWRRL